MSARSRGVFALPLLLLATPALAKSAASSCEPKNMAALAGWDGIWISADKETGIDGRSDTNWDLAGISAPWNDERWARMRTVLKQAASPQFKQQGWGFPMMMNSYAEFIFVISPRETAIISQYRAIRHVFTDGRGHLPEDERWPTDWGDSTGCWDGNTLTIDTLSVKFDPDYNPLSPPLSEGAHFRERLRLVAPDRIEGEMTITDPAYLTGAWTLPLTYERAGGLDRLIHDTFENDRMVADGESLTIAPPRQTAFAPSPAPPEVTLSPAELDRLVGTYDFDNAPLKLVIERRQERLFFEVPPALSSFLPMDAQSPLSFIAVDGAKIDFILDDAGKAVRFKCIGPDGATAKSGKRVNQTALR